MKFQFKYMLMAATAAVLAAGSVSCSEDEMRDLENVYAAPVDMKVTSATLADKTKEGNLRTFVMSLTTDNGKALNLALVGNEYFIPTNTYSPKAKADAKNGNLVTELSNVDGKKIASGGVSIVADGDNYTIKNSVIFAEDGTAYRFAGGFTCEFLPDDPTATNIFKSATIGLDGTVTLVGTTGGYTETLNMTTYQTEYSGEGNDFQIQLKLNNGKLAAGTYAPNTGYVIGHQEEVSMWGYTWMQDMGTIFYTIANGAKTATYVTSSDISVKKMGPLYKILLDQGKGGVYAQYAGALDSIKFESKADYVQYGLNAMDIKFKTGKFTSSFDMTTYQTTYTGSGAIIQLQPYTADGKLAPGKYTIGATAGPGVCNAGNVGMFGPSGTMISEIVDGVAQDPIYITEGTVNVEVDKQGVYTISLDCENGGFTFVGKLE